MTRFLPITTRSHSLSSSQVWGIVGTGLGRALVGIGINVSSLSHSDCIPSEQAGLPRAGGVEQAFGQGNLFAKLNFLRFSTQSGEYRHRQAIPSMT